MTDLFATIFELMSLYSKDLGEHLRGFNMRCKAYDAGAFYNTIGLVIIFVSFLASFLYYKALDMPRYTSSGKWFMVGIIFGLIPFLWAYLKVSNDISNKSYCKELQITNGDTWGFAFTILFYYLILYFLFSFLKIISNNHRKIPF